MSNNERQLSSSPSAIITLHYAQCPV